MDYDQELEKLRKQEEETAAEKASLGKWGAIADNLSNRQSFGNFFTGKMNPKQDASAGFKAASDALGDPSERRKQLLERYKLAKDEEHRGKELALKKEALGIRKMLADSKAAGAGKAPAKLTKGQEAVDRNFAKTYEDYVLSGGYADAEKNLKALEDVSGQLSNTDLATGGFIGRMPKFIRDATGSSALQQNVEEVIQRNLRQILGAQFAEKEGAQLIARGYDPTLSEEENIKRINRLALQMRKAMDAKKGAIDHFEQHGTMAGFRGKLPSMDMFAESDQDEPADGSGFPGTTSANAGAEKQAPTRRDLEMKAKAEEALKINPNDKKAMRVLEIVKGKGL